jgi:hypothetical protein
LCAELRQQERKVQLFAVEVGARGLVSGSVYDLFKQLGMKGGVRGLVSGSVYDLFKQLGMKGGMRGLVSGLPMIS